MSVSCEGGNITWNLKIDTSGVVTNITELNQLLTTYVALARRSGLPENVIEAIAQIQQLRIAIESLYRSLMMLLTATGPFGWITAIGGIGLSGFMLAGQVEIRRPRY